MKKQFEKLGLQYPAVAIKYHYSVPESAEPVPWELIAMKEDPKSRAELKRRMDSWNTLSPDFILKK